MKTRKRESKQAREWPRFVFAASALLFAAVALIWRDAATWQNLHHLLHTPVGRIAGICLLLAQVIGAIAIIYPPFARTGFIVLGIVYTVFCLASIPDIRATPTVYGPYVGLFEQLSLVCGAIAGYAATKRNAARAQTLTVVARIGLGLCAVSFTLAQIFYFGVTARLVPTWIPPDQNFWAVLTTVAFALAAIAILANRHAGLAIELMTLMLVLFGLLVWVPKLVTQPGEHGNWSEFALNFLIAGAAGMVGDVKRS